MSAASPFAVPFIPVPKVPRFHRDCREIAEHFLNVLGCRLNPEQDLEGEGTGYPISEAAQLEQGQNHDSSYETMTFQ